MLCSCTWAYIWERHVEIHMSRLLVLFSTRRLVLFCVWTCISYKHKTTCNTVGKICAKHECFLTSYLIYVFLSDVWFTLINLQYQIYFFLGQSFSPSGIVFGSDDLNLACDLWNLLKCCERIMLLWHFFPSLDFVSMNFYLFSLIQYFSGLSSFIWTEPCVWEKVILKQGFIKHVIEILSNNTWRLSTLDRTGPMRHECGLN